MAAAGTDVARCECCGLTEECTLEYIAGVRERHHGRWICGLCTEAIKDEIARSARLLTTEEALEVHAIFRSSPPPANPAVRLISEVSRVLRRSFRSPQGPRSTPNSPSRENEGVAAATPPLARSESCFSTLSRKTEIPKTERWV